jgi:hypothetical protein
MKKYRILLLGLLVIFLVKSAQASSITIGAAELKLGMRKDAALSILNKNFQLSKLEESRDYYLITDKEEKGSTTKGSILFKNNVVSLIQKDWYVGSEIDDYSRALFILISKYSKNQLKPMQIRTISHSDVDIDIETIYLYVPNSDIYYSIQTIKYKGNTTYQISETLEK